jgi:hypothetical protein
VHASGRWPKEENSVEEHIQKRIGTCFYCKDRILLANRAPKNTAEISEEQE